MNARATVLFFMAMGAIVMMVASPYISEMQAKQRSPIYDVTNTLVRVTCDDSNYWLPIAPEVRNWDQYTADYCESIK